MISESLDDCISKFEKWKLEIESKGLRVNSKKTKFMLLGSENLRDPGAFPCNVCRKGVGVNSVFCSTCSHWVHKRFSGLTGRLKDQAYDCPRCLNLAPPLDYRLIEEVIVGNATMDVEPKFCYLGNMSCAGGGCELAVITRFSVTWGKFKKLLPILTSKHSTLELRGKLYTSCVYSALLYGSENWAPTVAVLRRLQRNDRSMIRWICGVKPKDRSPSSIFLKKLKITDIKTLLQNRRLRWYGHVRRSFMCIKDVLELPLPRGRSRSRPAKTWLSCVEKDMESYDLENVDLLNRAEWRKCISRLLYTPATGTPTAV